MNLAQVTFLKRPETQAILASLQVSQQNHLQLATKLNKTYQRDEVHALIETALLRQRAVKKFSRAADMLFLRDALEQASAEVIADYRAKRFEQAGVCLLYTSPSPRDRTRSRMPSSA